MVELYRHYDSDDTLLYVGISLNAVARLYQHKKSKHHEQIKKVKVEQFPSKEDALSAEKDAIVNEKPKYNIMHNDHPKNNCVANRRSFYNTIIDKSRREMYEFMKDFDTEMNSIRLPNKNIGKDAYINHFINIFKPPQDVKDTLTNILSPYRIDKLKNTFNFVLKNFAPLDLGGNGKWCGVLIDLMKGKAKLTIIKEYVIETRWYSLN
jgi:predicted GIY-YIG superfamily endonuclease